MNLKKSLIYSVLLSQTVCAFSEEKPNLLFIMADQWRGDALGCLEKEPVITPNLDALVKDGVIFNQAVSSYPLSSPARAMLMSGVYPHKTGVPGNCNSVNSKFGVELKKDLVCWSDVLSSKNYDLGYIGKWHLDAPQKPYIKTLNNMGKVKWNEWTPPERRHGFKFWHAYGTYDLHLNPVYWDTNSAREDFFFAKKWGPEYEADVAIKYLNRVDKNKPFSLVISINPPHTGYSLVPNKYKRIYQDLNTSELVEKTPNLKNSTKKMQNHFKNNVKNYYACITGVDEQIGRVIAELKRLNMYDNTIIVFTSDHGDSLGRNNFTGKNMYYDSAMRIPLIIAYPKKIKPRVDNSTLISYADLYPTMLSLMGFKNDIPKTVQTIDLSDAVINKNSDSNPNFQPYYKIITPSESVILNKPLEEFKEIITYRGLRYLQWTYVAKIKNGTIIDEILYDKINDPFQLKNISKENDNQVAKCRNDLIKFLSKTKDNVLTL